MKVVCAIYFVLPWFHIIEASQEDIYFIKDSRYDNMLPLQGLLWSLPLSSIINCGLECRTPSCLAFFSNGFSCHGYFNRMHDLVASSPETNMTYFEMKGRFGNLAARKIAVQSSVETIANGTYSPDQAVDGRRYPVAFFPGDSCAHTLDGWGGNEWWRVDLNETYYVTQVAILARIDDFAWELADIEISVAEFEAGNYELCGTTGANGWLGKFETFTCPRPIFGRYVLLEKLVANILCVCEVEVYADRK